MYIDIEINFFVTQNTISFAAHLTLSITDNPGKDNGNAKALPGGVSN